MTESKKKVLVVDDQSSIRDILRQMLSQLGHDVVLANGGEEALQVLQENRDIDMLLSDIHMQNMNGLEVLKTCCLMYPTMPVVLMSGNSKDNTIIEALREGATDYLIKPFELKQLSAVISRVDSICQDRRQFVQDRDLITSMTVNFELTSATLSVEKLQRVIKSTIKLYTCMPTSDLLNISMALEESVLNAHEHGNLELKSEWKEEFPQNCSESLFEKEKRKRLEMPEYSDRRIGVALNIYPEKVAISISDDGRGYPIGEIGDEASGKPYGMGLMLIRNLTDHISFNETGNVITFEKQLY